jgi:hypothetical protein
MESVGLQDRGVRLAASMSPEVAQWALIALIAILCLVARTPGPAGNFLREFAAFIFP